MRGMRQPLPPSCGLVLVGLAIGACRVSDLLSVPPPPGIVANSALTSLDGAESAFTGARALLFQSIAGVSGLLEWSELLTDEFTWSGFTKGFDGVNIDARRTVAGSGYFESGDTPLGTLLATRSALLIAAEGLRKFEPASGQSKVGKAEALVGYTELLLAEDYCGGVPLSEFAAGGGFTYGRPLTTDSLFATAEGHFVAALAHAAGNDTVRALASVGLGRARLHRGHFAAAASAVTSVPTNFVFNTDLGPTCAAGGCNPNIYSAQLPAGASYMCGLVNVPDREGGNGMNFVSASDPRLVLDSAIAQTCDGGTWQYPVKFGNPSEFIPLATGVEARLIEAEAALQAGQVNMWAADLNALRGDAASTHVSFPDSSLTIKPDSTTAGSATRRVDVMFRERAFWLFGTGVRLGDLRRLVRQYGRDAGTVFPSGPYGSGNNPNLPTPIPTYGSDVSLTLPTPASGANTGNPYYKGCLSSPGTA
jgi:starch-binding outer membrane protein, SusD/RagB family